MPIPFQIPSQMISGIPGEVAFDGPTRAAGVIVDSTSAADNVFGRAMTYNDNTVESVQAGGSGVFAGILIHPKAYAIDGVAMPNGAQGEVLFMGEVYVELTTTGGEIGAAVWFDAATGELGHGTAGTGQTQVPNCVISRHNVSPETPTLAVIKLTN